MKQLFFSGLLAIALVLSACDRQSSVNSPVVPTNGASLTKTSDQLNLTSEQMGQLDEMFYFGEDLSILLTAQQVQIVNTLAKMSGSGTVNGEKDIPRGALDLEALLIYRLILKANPDLTDEQKAQLQAAIEESMRARAAIMKNPELDREAKKAALDEEHQKLMDVIFGNNDPSKLTTGILTPEQVLKYQELRAQLEQERKDRREKWLDQRIDRQVQAWTKILGLDEGQQAAIKELLKNQATQAEALREQYKGQPDVLRAELKKLQDATNTAIYELLNDEQKAIWDKMHGKGRGDTGGTTGIDRDLQYWTKVLGLDDKQQAQMKEVLIAEQAAIQQAQIDNRGNPQGMKDAMDRINKETLDKLSGFLTPEQLALWQKMHQPGNGGIGPRR